LKPDITAPGGSFVGVPLFSLDSNHSDADGVFADIQANDSAPMQGTSMAAPIISGSVQVVIQAMGGYATWNWTRSQALQPKMLLLMTATETYPNIRELESSSTSPTLQRGGKDVHEGYGRVNLDAAVDALLRSYAIGSAVTDSLGKPPATSDISVVGQKLAWAGNVQLVSGTRYNFTLTVPSGADYDLYLYNSTGTAYGEPAIVAKSTNATTGGTEQFWVTAPYTGRYYVVVKRATENTGSGQFTLASSGPMTVNFTLNTPGLESALNVVHYLQNGVSKNGSIVGNAFSDLVDVGTEVTIDNPIYVSSTQRFWTTYQTAFFVQSDVAYTINYANQYFVAVNSSHGTPTSSQWVNQGGSFAVSVTSPTEVVASDSRWVCTGYRVDGDPLQAGTSYTFTDVQEPHDIVFSWTRQFYLTVSSPYGSPGGASWYDEGAAASAVLTEATVAGETGIQYVFTGWSGDASGTGLTSNSIAMDRAKTATANWKTQYYLTVSSAYGTYGGAGWYDSGASASATVSSLTVSGAVGTQYVFTGWSGDASGSGSPSNAIAMNGPKTATANWKTQHFLNVSSPYGNASGGGWYDSGASASATVSPLTVEGSAGTQHVFVGWSGDASGAESTSNALTLDSPKSAVANWKTQYYLTANSAHGEVSGAGWYDDGASASATLSASTVAGAAGTQYIFTGWSGDVSGTSLQSSVIVVNSPKTATANWKTQHYLTVNSSYGVAGGTGWYDSGSTVYATLAAATVPAGAGTQQVFAGWGGDASGVGLTSEGITMNSAKTATANWKTQYYLTVSTGYGTAGGEGWYDSGGSAYATLSSLTVTGAEGTRYAFTGWSGDASGIASPSSQIIMDSPKTAAANWKTQYYLNLSANFGAVSPESGWFDAGSAVTISATEPSAGSGERYVWNGWSGNYTGSDNPVSLNVDGAVSASATWTHQYMLTVDSPYGSPTPSSDWFDAGTAISASVNSPIFESFFAQRACTGWTGTGSVPATGTAANLLFNIESASTITWNWTTQPVLTAILLVIAVPASAAGIVTYVVWRRRRKMNADREEP
jgi:uncharacterized repeat protein (TIGR02543 family)